MSYHHLSAVSLLGGSEPSEAGRQAAGRKRRELVCLSERRSAKLIRATASRLIVFHASDIKITAATQMRIREMARLAKRRAFPNFANVSQQEEGEQWRQVPWTTPPHFKSRRNEIAKILLGRQLTQEIQSSELSAASRLPSEGERLFIDDRSGIRPLRLH